MEKKDRRPFLVSEAAAENILGKKLSEARKDKKIRQNAFVKLLEEYGISMSSSSYSCWETGARTPNAYQFLALCRALDIQDVMGYFLEEHGNVDGMEQLNPEGQALAQQYIRLLVRSGEYQREPDPDTEILDLDLYLQSASAGCGQFLDDDSRETISLPRSVVPAGTEFVVRISGDSMEPAFYDHQLAFVKRTVDLRPGDLGIFLLDGDGYIKKYEEALMCYNNTNDTTSLFLCMNNLGCLYRETNPEKAVQLLQKASFIAKELKDTSFIISNNHALLVQYFYYGRFEEAHALIPQIISCLDQIKDYQLLFLISNVYSRIHVLDSAQFYINKAIINHERDSMPYYQMYFFESLGEYELAKGDTLASLNYHQKSEQIASTLKSNNIKLNILDTEKQFDNDQYVRNRLKSRKLRTSLNIFIAFFLLTVICFACYYYYKKHRYDNLINELKQEYQNQANNLISLHNSIKELKICDENLKDFITSHTTLMQKVLEACYQAPKNVLGKEIKQIVLFQDKNKNNWEKLYHYIDAQYNDIMKTTKQNYPQLNDKDLLLIALTCLGFSYIQIAIIMGYSNHTSISVLKKRLAIKMKLENSINDYISSFI